MDTPRVKSESLNIKGLLSSYLSKWYLFVISVIVCLAVGFLFTRVYKQNYAVRANILIGQDDDQLGGGGGGASGAGLGLSALFGSSANVQDEVFVISSHTLYRNVAKELGINKMHFVRKGFLRTVHAYPDFPVDVDAPGIADTLRMPLLFNIKVDDKGVASVKVKDSRKTIAKVKDLKLPGIVKTPYGDFTVSMTPDYPKGKDVKTKILFMGFENVAETLTDQVEADLASRKSNMIQVAINTPNASYGSDILNTILDKYNERGISEKRKRGEQTATFLEDRINLIGGDLDDAELAIQKFKEANGITDLEAEAIYQSERRSLIESDIQRMKIEMELLKMTKEFLMDSLHNNELAPVNVSTGSVASGLGAYNQLVMERTELLQNARPDNYALTRLDNRMDMTRRNLLSSTDHAIENLQVRIDEIRKQDNDNRSRLGRIPTQERAFISMMRQQEMKQEIFKFLLERKEENSMMLANAIPKGRVVDEAFVLSKPLGLSKKMILIIFFFIGLILPPIYLYLRKLVLDRVETRGEMEQHTSAPVLGEMCNDHSGRNLVVTEHDTSSATELFRLMRTNLQFILGNPADKVVLMTSTKSGEGKSFISINLAASLALQKGKRVLLVGMDIRNPQLANYLGVNPQWGLTNYLAGAPIGIDDIINPVAGAKSLDVIVAGPIPPNPAELLMSEKVDEMFATLRERYDYIIIDSAPVGMVSDTFTLDRLADATVYVTRINFTTLSDLKFVESVYTEKRLKRLSLVINGTHSRKGYGYGYGRNVKK